MNQAKRHQRDVKRFWAQVDKKGPDDCWLWKGRKDRCGYGIFCFISSLNTPRVAKFIGAHRYSMQLLLGHEIQSPTRKLNEGMLVLHRCDNPACVNPVHLFIGTQKDNISDRDEKERQSRGELRYNHKLTDEIVREMRQMFATGKHTITQISRKFGFRFCTTWDAVNKRSWKHVD